MHDLREIVVPTRNRAGGPSGVHVSETNGDKRDGVSYGRGMPIAQMYGNERVRLE